MSDAGDTYLPPDTIVLLNAGIDIGTATSQMLVSRLVLKRLGRAHSSRYIVVSRETVFDSPVVFTPYVDTLTIDSAKLIATITEWLDDAAHVGAIESGVVLLTGEAVRRTNAEAISGPGRWRDSLGIPLQTCPSRLSARSPSNSITWFDMA